MIPFWTGKLLVKSKWTNDYLNPATGETTTYYNIKVVDLVNIDKQTFSVPLEVYNMVEEGKEYNFSGNFGSNDKGKWWSIKSLAVQKTK